MPDHLTLGQARRVALAAQGFADRRPATKTTAAHFNRVLARTKLLQMDSVNIAVRAHYLPVFSRLGAYDTDLLHRAAWRPRAGRRTLVEYWAHEAALIPVGDWPLFGWRMQRYREGRYQETQEVLRARPSLVADVRAVIAEYGAMMPRQVSEALGIEHARSEPGGWWNRGEIKHLCEALFAAGEFSAVRDDTFNRYYDLAERVVGHDVAAHVVDETTAHRELISRAAQALGVATTADLADYYRLKTVEARPAIADLVDAGELQRVSVPGWPQDTYLVAGTTIPRKATAAAILSPFDPLVFYRPRAERLFDFHYRIEIYVPEPKRVYGYYVHPFLLGDQIAARVDLKADRRRGVLEVPGAYCEPGVDRCEVTATLLAELTSLAHWRGLREVRIGDRGDLVAELKALQGAPA